MNSALFGVDSYLINKSDDLVTLLHFKANQWAYMACVCSQFKEESFPIYNLVSEGMKFVQNTPSRGYIGPTGFCNLSFLITVVYITTIFNDIRVKENKNILYAVQRRKANWIGHILCRICLLKYY